MSGDRAKLSICSLGCALGITWALGLLIMGWLAWLSGWAIPMVEVIGSAYIGYEPTFWGSVIGAIWGFADMFIAGVIIAAVYNGCVCGKKCS